MVTLSPQSSGFADISSGNLLSVSSGKFSYRESMIPSLANLSEKYLAEKE